jgi:hypothetical protein
LLDLREVIEGILVEGNTADLDERYVLLKPLLG